MAGALPSLGTYHPERHKSQKNSGKKQMAADNHSALVIIGPTKLCRPPVKSQGPVCLTGSYDSSAVPIVGLIVPTALEFKNRF